MLPLRQDGTTKPASDGDPANHTADDAPDDTTHDVDVLVEEASQLLPPLSAADEVRWRHLRRTTDATSRLAALRDYLHHRGGSDDHGDDGDDAPTALCLSGGGIRSATFNLGVVQALAAEGLLPRFHFLSSVSGGGYLASWLSAWVRNEGLAQESARRRTAAAQAGGLGHAGSSAKVDRTVDPRDFAQAQAKVFRELGGIGNGQPEEPSPLRRLRAFSSYLSPMRGLSADAMTLLAIYLRNVILNWLVLIPLLLAVLLLPRWLLANLQAPMPEHCWTYALAAAALLLIAWTIAYMASDLPASPENERPVGQRVKEEAPRRPRAVFLPLVLPLAVAAYLIVCLIAWHARGDYPLPLVAETFIPHEDVPLFRWLRRTWWPEALALLDARVAYPLLLSAVGGAVLQALSSIAGGTLLRRVRDVESGSRPATWRALVAVSFSGAVTGVGLFTLVGALLSVARDADPSDQRVLALVGVPLLLAVFWMGVTLYAAWRRPIGHEDEREWWARAGARWIALGTGWLVMFLLVLFAPTLLLSWTGLKSAAGTAAAGAGTGALGVLLALVGYASKRGPAWRQQIESLSVRTGLRVLDIAAVGFIVLLLASLSLAFTLAMRLDHEVVKQQDALLYSQVILPAASNKDCKQPSTLTQHCAHWTDMAIHRYERSLATVAPMPLLMSAIALLALALTVSHRIGVNAFSLHSLYGNRLVRAYLAASRPSEVRRPHWFTGFDPKDNVPMHELWPTLGAASSHSAATAPRLFHVVNIALNLVQASERRLEWQDRKATAFTVTPLHAGSAITGYVPSHLYIESPHRAGISLGAAMTISGAAASPNMGYHSSLPVAFAMTLFNLRLGLWMPNPRWPWQAEGRENAGWRKRLRGWIRGGPPAPASVHRARWPWRRDEPTLGLSALLSEALGMTSEDSQFLSLSDGGHFDNMGLYEMVRRRCRRIVLIDASADPDYTFDDLMSTMRKIRVDMGIPIEFRDGLPAPRDKQGNGRPFAVADIRYEAADPSGRTGQLVLIKPALPDDDGDDDGKRLPPDVRRYEQESARGKERFPQQRTSDQFFDEAQFESYRMLGLHLGREAFRGGRLIPPPPSPSPAPAGPPLRTLKPSQTAGAAHAERRTASAREQASTPEPAKGSEGGASVLAVVAGAGAVKQITDHIGLITASALVSAVTVTGVVKLADATVKLDKPEVQIANPTVRLVTAALAASGASAPGGAPSVPGAPAPAGAASVPASEASAPIELVVLGVDTSQLQRSVQEAASAASALTRAASDAQRTTLEAVDQVRELGVQSAKAASEAAALSERLAKVNGGPGVEGHGDPNHDTNNAYVFFDRTDRELLNKIHAAAKEASSNAIKASDAAGRAERNASAATAAAVRAEDQATQAHAAASDASNRSVLRDWRERLDQASPRPTGRGSKP